MFLQRITLERHQLYSCPTLPTSCQHRETGICTQKETFNFPEPTKICTRQQNICNLKSRKEKLRNFLLHQWKQDNERRVPHVCIVKTVRFVFLEQSIFQGVNRSLWTRNWNTQTRQWFAGIKRSVFVRRATVSRIGRMESCTCRRCRGVPPPPSTTTTPTPLAWHENVMDGWGTRPLRWLSVLVFGGGAASLSWHRERLRPCWYQRFKWPP